MIWKDKSLCGLKMCNANLWKGNFGSSSFRLPQILEILKLVIRSVLRRICSTASKTLTLKNLRCF